MLRARYLGLIGVRCHTVEHMPVDFLAATSMSIECALVVNHWQRTRFAVLRWVGPILVAHAELLSFDVGIRSMVDSLVAGHFVLNRWSGTTFGALGSFIFHLLEFTTVLTSEFVEVAIGAADLITVGWISCRHGSLLLHLGFSLGVSVEDVFCVDSHILNKASKVKDLVRWVGSDYRQ